jgi:hypothetical protein
VLFANLITWVSASSGANLDQNRANQGAKLYIEIQIIVIQSNIDFECISVSGSSHYIAPIPKFEKACERSAAD